MKHAYKNGAVVFPDDPSSDEWIYIKGSFVKKLLGAARANAPVTKPFSGLIFQVIDDGLDMRVDVEAVAAAAPHPLKVVPANDGTQRVRVYYGGVGPEIPSNFSPGDNPPLLLAVAGSGVIYCEVTRDEDSGDFSTGSIVAAGSFPTETATRGIGRIASYSVGADKIIHIGQIATGTLYCDYCDGWRWGT